MQIQVEALKPRLDVFEKAVQTIAKAPIIFASHVGSHAGDPELWIARRSTCPAWVPEC